MNTRDDIHRELFARLAAAGRLDPFRPSLDEAAVRGLHAAAGACAHALETDAPGRLRAAAMEAAVAALFIVYSIDDALS